MVGAEHRDEANFALIMETPSSLAVLPGLICLLLSYWFLIIAFPRGRRIRSVGPPLLGVSSGIALWGSVPEVSGSYSVGEMSSQEVSAYGSSSATNSVSNRAARLHSRIAIVSSRAWQYSWASRSSGGS